MISEFPVLFWIDRGDEITYPRDDEGNRFVKRTPPRDGLPPLDLNNYTALAIDNGIGYLTAFYGWFFDGITHGLRTMLSAITSVFVGTPWIITMGAILAIAYSMAGARVTIFVAASLAYLALFGFWQTAMDTMSLVVAASIICVVFGLPLGVWIGKSARAQSFVTPILDIMQTIPSFVYLLPAVAFFSIGKPPGILATVIFAMPPMVRLTALGIKHVPESTKEAALAFGANPRQLLTKVELPLALPSIMAGVNQVVMMSLSMVVVAALIGAGGMGFLVTEALANTRTGAGLLAGIGIALLAMMIDRVVQKANVAISDLNWTGAKAIAHVIKAVITGPLGSEAEIIKGLSDQAIIGAGMDKGDGSADVWTDMWMPNQQGPWDKYIKDAKTVDHNEPYLGGQGMFVPTYMADKIKSFEDLKNPEIAAMFDKDGNGKGEYWAGDASWKSTKIWQVKMKDYGLSELWEPEIISDATFKAQLKSSIGNQKPILFYYWSPEWIHAAYDIKPLAEPAHTEGCMDLKLDQDDWLEASKAACATPDAKIYVSFSKSLEKRNPAAAKFLKNIKLDPAVVNDWILKIGRDEMDAQDVAEAWVKENMDTVNAWIK